MIVRGGVIWGVIVSRDDHTMDLSNRIVDPSASIDGCTPLPNSHFLTLENGPNT